MSANRLKDSLFIIGAGAHVPYGMPTGLELRESIRKLYSYDGPFVFANHDADEDLSSQKGFLLFIARSLQIVTNVTGADLIQAHTQTWFEMFLESFCESHVLSIDTYLSNLKNEPDKNKAKIFGSFGKLLIAYYISRAERQTYLGTRKDDWIHFFIDQFIKKDPTSFFQAPPKIITFNYDRILERMLYTHLIEHHKWEPIIAKRKIDSLNILHVYGDLGDYTNWYMRKKLPSPSFYQNAINNIHVIGEERAQRLNMDIQKTIQSFEHDSSCMYFLGYGYDEDNNTLLRNSFSTHLWFSSKTKLYSTSINITPVDIARVASTLGTTKMFAKDGSGIEAYDCRKLLSEVGPLQI